MRTLVLVLVLLAAPAAHAHQTSVKYIDLVASDAHTLDVVIRFEAGDVAEAMGLPADANPTVGDAYLDARVPPYVQRWFALAGCSLGTPSAQRDETAFLRVAYAAQCPDPREVTLDFTRFFELDRRHEAIVQLSAPGTTAIQTIVRANNSRITLRAGESPSLYAWVRTGMDHIYDGVDHLLFVIALLLVVMLQPGTTRNDWHLRSFPLTLRSTALVITAFTIAHSITLITAALGLVTLPRVFVEAMIAVSIVYTAAEDIVKPDVRWRFALTFGFGLIHGLGFASTLSALLPPRDVVVPLLCFNLGVEIGQLSIVAVVLPLLWLLVHEIGAARYRRYFLPSLAAPIIFVGLAMVVDRVM
jgi:hypothetical protein